MAAPTQRLVLKLARENEFRRLTVQASPVRMDDVRKAVESIFPALAGQKYALSYTDDDGDCILVTSENELAEAILVAQSHSAGGSVPVLRLNVRGPLAAAVADVESDVDDSVLDEALAETDDEAKEAAAPAKEEEGVKLSALVPASLRCHPFVKHVADEVRAGVGQWVGASQRFLPPGNLDVAKAQAHVRELCDAVIAEADVIVPEELLAHPFATTVLEHILTNEEEIVRKFDRMQAGLADLGDDFDPIQLYCLWLADGDADGVRGMRHRFSAIAPFLEQAARDHAFVFPGVNVSCRVSGCPVGAPAAAPPAAAAAEPAAEKPKEEEKKKSEIPVTRAAAYRHPAVCDGCNGRIDNVRWKCFNCADFDFCDKCYGVERHDSAHAFIRLTPESAHAVSLGGPFHERFRHCPRFRNPYFNRCPAFAAAAEGGQAQPDEQTAQRLLVLEQLREHRLRRVAKAREEAIRARASAVESLRAQKTKDEEEERKRVEEEARVRAEERRRVEELERKLEEEMVRMRAEEVERRLAEEERKRLEEACKRAEEQRRREEEERAVRAAQEEEEERRRLEEEEERIAEENKKRDAREAGITSLMQMGFDRVACEGALEATNGNVEMAIDMLLQM